MSKDCSFVSHCFGLVPNCKHSSKNSKTVYGGMNSTVSVSHEKVQANQRCVYFYRLYLFLSSENNLFTPDIQY